MVKKIYYCDRCGKEVECEGRLFGKFFACSEDDQERSVDMDLCEDCVNEISLFARIKEKGPAAEPIPAKKHAEVKYDMSKAVNLWKNGWNIARIAADIGCTANDVLRYLDRYEAQHGTIMQIARTDKKPLESDIDDMPTQGQMGNQTAYYDGGFRI